MKKTIVIGIAVITVMVVVVAALLIMPPKERVGEPSGGSQMLPGEGQPTGTLEYSEISTCNSDCKAGGYEEGDCKWPSEVANSEYLEIVDVGECLIPQSKHCGNEGQCNCYCYTAKTPEEIEPPMLPEE